MSKIKMVGNNKNLEEKIQQDFSKQISFFNDKIHEFLSQIEPVTLDVEIVKGEELQAFLLSQVTSDFNKRIFINDNNSLDEFLSLSEEILLFPPTSISAPSRRVVSSDSPGIKCFMYFGT